MTKENLCMFQSLMLFLAPEAAHTQATPTSPPAVARPVRRPARGSVSLRLVADVVANAVGFAAMLAGCWMVLQLMQAFLQA
jgi:hypothetical protein